MKLKHNKKRNTAFLYEVLINELSKASMHNMQEKKKRVINILKTFFSKGRILREELEIYKSFENIDDLDRETVYKIIHESRTQASMINKKMAVTSKNKLINLINKQLGKDSWDTFIKDYKKMATINQVVFSKSSPKKQVFLENKILDMSSQEKRNKKQFPSINKLALNTFLQKFNSEYSNKLNENQKNLLNKYITSFQDEGAEISNYLYMETTRLKESLEDHILKNGDSSKDLQLVLEKVKDYSKRPFDKQMLSEIIKVQSLVEELENGN